MVLAYYFFKNNFSFCRNRLAKTLALFPNMFSIELDIPKRALLRVANILVNNFRKRFNEALIEK